MQGKNEKNVDFFEFCGTARGGRWGISRPALHVAPIADFRPFLYIPRRV